MPQDWIVNKKLKTHLILHEEFINYFSQPPPLLRMVIVSLATDLWTEPEVKTELISSFHRNQCKNISFLEEKVLNRLFGCQLPPSLKTDVSLVVRPIGLQLIKAFANHERHIANYFLEGGLIYWTAEGTINYVSILMEIFKKEIPDYDNFRFFHAACSYCLEEYVLVLWEKLSHNEKSRLRTSKIYELYDYHLLMYWAFNLENNLDCFLNKIIGADPKDLYDQSLSVTLNMITWSIQTCNVYALKYFWKMMTVKERNDSLEKWILQATQPLEDSSFNLRNNEYLDILCFLISHVKDKIILSYFFLDHPFLLELLFQSWPHQRFFLPVFTDLMDNLSDYAYVPIMGVISSSISKGGMEVHIFKQFWNSSSSRLKKSFLQEVDYCSKMVLNLLKTENMSIAFELLNDASEEEEKQIILFLFGWKEFKNFIYSTELNFFHILLSKVYLPSECNFINIFNFNKSDTFKILFQNEYTDWHICYEWIYEGNFKAVDIFLKWAFPSEGAMRNFKQRSLSRHRIFTYFIMLCNYERMHQFMKWYLETESDFRQFRRDFLHEENNSYFKRLLRMMCIRKETAVDILDKFLNFNLAFSEEVEEFKFICRDLVGYALERCSPEVATILLNCSLDNSYEKKKYKNNFALREINNFLPFNDTFFMFYDDHVWNNVKKIIIWSSPLSDETTAELKKLILKKVPLHYRHHQLNILQLLDSLVEKNNE